MKYCCDTMQESLENGIEESGYVVEYSAKTGLYYLVTHNNKDGDRQIMNYCPWCGKQVPKLAPPDHPKIWFKGQVGT